MNLSDRVARRYITGSGSGPLSEWYSDLSEATSNFKKTLETFEAVEARITKIQTLLRSRALSRILTEVRNGRKRVEQATNRLSTAVAELKSLDGRLASDREKILASPEAGKDLKRSVASLTRECTALGGLFAEFDDELPSGSAFDELNETLDSSELSALGRKLSSAVTELIDDGHPFEEIVSFLEGLPETLREDEGDD